MGVPWLPEEILRMIFPFLLPKDMKTAVLVGKLWDLQKLEGDSLSFMTCETYCLEKTSQNATDFLTPISDFHSVLHKSFPALMLTAA